MSLYRYLRTEAIKLELDTRPESPDPEEELTETERADLRWKNKETVILELVELLCASGRVGNIRKLGTDIINREKKASTGIGHGLAIPHVRTKHAKEFIVAVSRSTPGIDFDAPDGSLSHLFIAMVSPPYDDKTYLRIYRQLGMIFQEEWVLPALMEASDEHELLRLLRSVLD